MSAQHASGDLAHYGAWPSSGGVRWPHMYLVFFAWTFFSLYLYSRYSTLGDSQAYLTGAYEEEDGKALRTLVITAIAEAVYAVVRLEVLAHLVFSAFAATGVGYLVKQARLQGAYKWPFLIMILTPNFGVWASAIGRESLFVGMMGFCLGAVLEYARNPGVRHALLAIACVAGMTFIRAPYGIGMALFLLMFLVYRSGPATGLSTGVQALLFGTACLFALVVGWTFLDAYITGEILPKAERYFTINSETTRTWVEVDTTVDLAASLWWTLPLALVGPTPGEVWARPIMLPFFLSGLVVLGSLLYSVRLAFRAPPGRVRKILVLGWLPAVFVILFAYVPFGIYNPGSAIRYASCFLLFLVFPSLLLSAVAADRQDAGAAHGHREAARRHAAPSVRPAVDSTPGAAR